MTTLVIICIMLTLTVLVTTSWYRSTKNAELLKLYAQKALAEKQITSLENQYKNSQSRMKIAQDNCKELQCDVANKRASISSLHAEIRELRDNLKRRRDELGLRQKLKAIKFTANVPLNGWTKTEFKLGVGPCGLTVDRLKWVELNDRYVLTQYHSDGSRKEFEYLKDDIKGRIEKYLND